MGAENPIESVGLTMGRGRYFRKSMAAIMTLLLEEESTGMTIGLGKNLPQLGAALQVVATPAKMIPHRAVFMFGGKELQAVRVFLIQGCGGGSLATGAAEMTGSFWYLVVVFGSMGPGADGGRTVLRLAIMISP